MPPQSTQAPRPKTTPDDTSNPTVSAAIPSYARTPDPTPTPTETPATTTPGSERATASPPETPTAAAGDSAAATSDTSGPIPASPTSRRGRGLRLLAGKVDPQTRAMLAQATGALLSALGTLLHLRFANERRFGPNDVWLPDGDDQQFIAGPLASIAARHVPDGLGEDSDLSDLILAAVATGGYTLKNVQKRGQLVRLEKTGAWSAAERADPPAPSPAASFAGAPGGGL